MNDCPKRAIQTGHGYIIGIMCLLNIRILSWFWNAVALVITLPAGNGWVETGMTIVRWMITFLVMVVSYRIYHYLLRVPVIREIFYFTSGTLYKFWRRYKPGKSMVEKLP